MASLAMKNDGIGSLLFPNSIAQIAARMMLLTIGVAGRQLTLPSFRPSETASLFSLLELRPVGQGDADGCCDFRTSAGHHGTSPRRHDKVLSTNLMVRVHRYCFRSRVDLTSGRLCCDYTAQFVVTQSGMSSV
jgi:hypothetical protein